MGPGMSLELRPSLRQEVSLRQQNVLIQEHVLSLRISLIHALTGSEYKPYARCPQCERELAPREIIAGFNTDPNNFDTTCTRCGHRFAPILRYANQHGSGEMPFYCSAQALEKLRGMEGLSPEVLRKKEHAAYNSAIVHHGSLKAAFAKIGVKYAFVELTDPKRKITPFLGRLPDTVIAELSDVSVHSVRQLRKKLRIGACSRQSMLDEIGE